LRARATIHQAKDLFHQSNFARAQQTLQDKLDKLVAKQGSISGRNCFYRDYCASVGQSPADISAFEHHRTLLGEHTVTYNQLTKRRRLAYEEQARAENRAHEMARRDDVECLQERLALQRNRAEQHMKQHGIPNNNDSCRFGEVDFANMASLLQDRTSAASSARLAQDMQYESPAVPSLEEQRILLDAEHDDLEEDALLPGWQAVVCAHRERFACTAIYKVTEEGIPVVYFHLFSQQQPRVGVYLQLNLKTEVLDYGSDLFDGVGSRLMPPHYREFSYTPARFHLHHEVPFDEDDELGILTDLCFQGDIIISRHQPEAFEIFVSPFVGVTAARRTAVKKPARPQIPADVEERLRQQYPWLTDADFANPRRHSL
jgi:hypothetical protein